MKELKVLKKAKYEGVNIYIMQYDTFFQYLFSWRGEVYQDHVFLNPPWWKKLLAKFGYSLYTDEQIEYGSKIMFSGATRSIQALKNPSPLRNIR